MNEDDSAAETRSGSSVPPERVVDFSHYSPAQLQDFLGSIDPASRPATHRALLEELARRASAPAQPAAVTPATVRFTRHDGVLGWLEAKSRGLRLYGAGSVQLAGEDVLLGGWERTWLWMPVEAEQRVRISEIRGVASHGNQVQIQCTRAGLRSRRFQIHMDDASQARAFATQISTAPSQQLDRKWAALSEFNLRVQAGNPYTWASYLLVGLNVAIYVAMVVAARGALVFAPEQLIAWGADIGYQTLGGQPWRLLTATFLHANLLHLLLNMWVLWGAGRVIERLYGSRTYLALYLYAGVLGSVASVFWNPLAVAVGASGAIFGVLGGFLALLLRRRGAIPHTVIRAHLLSTTLFVLVNLVAGMRSPVVDNAAHVGGLVSGFFLGWWLARPPAPNTWKLSRRQLIDASLAALLWLAAGLWLAGMFDHELSASERYMRAHSWYIRGEERSLAAATRIYGQLSAGTLAEPAAAKQVEQEVLKFWREANERLSKEKPSADPDQRKVQSLLLQYVVIRQRWAEAWVQGIKEADDGALKKAAADVEESQRLVARMQRLAVRSTLDHRHRPLSNSPYVRKLAGLFTNATWKCVGAGAALLETAGKTQPARDGPTGRAMAGCQAQRAFVAGDYRALDTMVAQHTARMADLLDGSSSLSGIYGGLSELFSTEENWPQYLSKLSDWRRERPDSVNAELVEALLYRDGAWAARGHGAATDVGPAQWAAFSAQSEMAAAGLSDLESRGQASPLWYWLSMTVGEDRDASGGELNELFEQGTQRFPEYLPLYAERVRELMPRWSGSYEKIDAFVSKAHAATAKRHNFEMYARLYDHLASLEDSDFELFQESNAEWAIMQHGFKDLMAAHPQSRWLLNRFAYFACIAKDAEQYRPLRAQIAADVWTDAWRGKHSVQRCDEKLLPPAAASPKPPSAAATAPGH